MTKTCSSNFGNGMADLVLGSGIGENPVDLANIWISARKVDQFARHFN